MKHQFSVVFVCLVFVVFSTTASMADLSEGLLAYWPFDEGSGTVAHDMTGNGYDGTLVNGPTWTTDSKVGPGAILCNGIDGRVAISSFDAAGGSGITLACWFFTSNLDTPGDDPRMISKAIGGASADHWFMLSSGREGANKILRFRLKTDGETGELKANTDGIIDLDVWIHAALTWDGTTMRVYKNGVEAGTFDKTGELAVDPSVNLAIGNQPDGAENRPCDGIIDDVAIWNRALSPDEILDMMANGVAAAVKPGGKLATTWGTIKY